MGIAMAELIVNHFLFLDSILSLYERALHLLSKPWILKTLGFVLLVGSVMSLLSKSGGVNGFIEFLTTKHSLITSPRRAILLTYFIGIIIFIESSITALVTGAIGRQLYDRHKISRAKLAFVCDSTSAPICSIIAINGWGALLLGLISAQISIGLISGSSIEILINSIAYNFYAFSALAVTFIAIMFNINIGAMKNAKPNPYVANDFLKGDMSNMLLPLMVMIITVFISLFLTGGGDILSGSGSSSIFYAQIVTILFMLFIYMKKEVMNFSEFRSSTFSGAFSMFNIATILLFAFLLSDATSQMKTGIYLASFAQEAVLVHYMAALIFLVSSIIAFSTGTSWGTFSIMVPIAVPLAVALDADVALCIGAVISGGVFGDHCSPISDTTIISSMAAECDPIEHVKTQLPYALISGAIATGLFIAFSS
ncbi:MAG: sodium:proton antiporter [Helicobacteraceae bacterium]|nr:sodium:proton antiporter [Helicobacteraceae bacterium]